MGGRYVFHMYIEDITDQSRKCAIIVGRLHFPQTRQNSKTIRKALSFLDAFFATTLSMSRGCGPISF